MTAKGARPASATAADAGSRGLDVGAWLAPWRALRSRMAAAWRIEVDERRPFLWLPAAAGAGVLLYMAADREPALWLVLSLGGLFLAVAGICRRRRLPFAACLGIVAALGGMASARWHSIRVAAPVLDRIRIVHLTGYIEEMDFRRTGARFLLRIASATELTPAQTPFRVRLTMKRTPEVEAGAFVAVTARLLPPAHAALPGGYDFARDAYFARIGAVGSVLGRPTAQAPPQPPDAVLAAWMRLDRARNALARRVDAIVGGDAGAIAAAMVTGKRDLLSDDAKDLIREAGIFHIITISGFLTRPSLDASCGTLTV